MRQLGITVDAYTWPQIKKIAKEGKAREVFYVGQRFPVKLRDDDMEVEILGFDHDDVNTITFGLVDCFARHRMNHEYFNAGGWHCCEMRRWLNKDVLAKLPKDLQECIKIVSKITSIGAGIPKEKIVSDDKLFLFSQIEVFGSNPFSVEGEGKQYDGFKVERKKKDSDGDASHWWLRSLHASDATSFCFVYSDGAADNAYASNAIGVAFGFVI